jgi:hypothetical protein
MKPSNLNITNPAYAIKIDINDEYVAEDGRCKFFESIFAARHYIAYLEAVGFNCKYTIMKFSI